MSSGEKYLSAAYVVLFLAILVYLVIHSLRLARLSRELEELAEQARAKAGTDG